VAFSAIKKAVHTPSEVYSWTASLRLLCGMRGIIVFALSCKSAKARQEGATKKAAHAGEPWTAYSSRYLWREL